MLMPEANFSCSTLTLVLLIEGKWALARVIRPTGSGPDAAIPVVLVVFVALVLGEGEDGLVFGVRRQGEPWSPTVLRAFGVGKADYDLVVLTVGPAPFHPLGRTREGEDALPLGHVHVRVVTAFRQAAGTRCGSPGGERPLHERPVMIRERCQEPRRLVLWRPKGRVPSLASFRFSLPRTLPLNFPDLVLHAGACVYIPPA